MRNAKQLRKYTARQEKKGFSVSTTSNITHNYFEISWSKEKKLNFS